MTTTFFFPVFNTTIQFVFLKLNMHLNEGPDIISMEEQDRGGDGATDNQMQS